MWYSVGVTLVGASAQAYDQLVQELNRGLYSPGTRLPGERALAGQLGVSRVTLRVALAELEAEGRLSRSAQRGWFVPAQVVGEPPSTLQSFTEMARARGLHPTARVLRQEVHVASLDEASRLRIAPTSPVLRIERLRGLDGRPVCFDIVALPVERVPALVAADLTDASLYETLKERCGISIHRSGYSVMAANADTNLAALLETVVGAAVLIGDEIAYSADGTPILMGRNTYRGDAYRFEADLYRRTD